KGASMRRGLWLVLLGLVLSACGESSAPTPAASGRQPMVIVATTGMIGDIVRRVVGERGDVKVLMGAGVDPHLYQPTRDDMAALLGADVVFYNGLLLEGRMTDALERAASGERGVFAVTELIDP